jgi:hypothetical protein
MTPRQPEAARRDRQLTGKNARRESAAPHDGRAGILAYTEKRNGRSNADAFRRHERGGGTMLPDRIIRKAHSCATDTRQAVRELHEALRQDDPSLLVFFCSSAYDLPALAEEINRLFAGIQVIGCTTAGEIGAAGYRQHSLSGASFSRHAGVAVTGHLDCLQSFSARQGQAFVSSLLQQLEARAPDADPENTFAFMLIDGLSVREEPVVSSLQTALGRISLFGGSAGDDQNYERTWVFHDGSFRSDSVVLLLLSTHLPFRTFKTQHFVRNSERMVVTEADAARRIIKEINGLPAADEYARVIGCTVEELDADHFAARPVVVFVDGNDYVRSIQKCNPDGSLTFFCAIEEGLVLRVANGEDLLANLEDTFSKLQREIGPPELVFGCDCILRNLEATQYGLKGRVQEILQKYNTIGFSTYGEQFGGVHVNQTFTGVAIGRGREEAPHD